MFLTGVPNLRAGGSSLINDLSNLGLTTGLKVCLDAGDLNSYDGSSQTWKDLSGNGTDFYRGSGSSGDGADPTFTRVGNGGTYQDYFSYDGGDYFTFAQANPSWLQTFHKDNAALTIAGWAYASGITSTAANFPILGDAGATGIGFSFGNTGTVGSGLNLGFTCYTASTIPLDASSSHTISNNAWNFVAVSFNEATGALLFNINGTTDTLSGQTYSSPSSANAGSTVQIGAGGGGFNPATAGCRIAAEAVWDRALSSTELGNLFSVTRSRFGL